jgi:hypothetical protein
MGLWAKPGKETIARTHRIPNGLHIRVCKLAQGVLRVLGPRLRTALALLRLCSGMLTLSSG